MTQPFAEKVSVAIATYNGARFLPEQLVSLSTQTRLPDELVIADDCSTDATISIVAQFAASAPFPVRIVRHPKNIGILENFYSAFDATTGSLIFYCDQDDIWNPAKIKKLLSSFRPNTMLAMHQSEIVGENLETHNRSAPGNPRYGHFSFPADTASIHGYGHQMAFRRPVLEMMHAMRDVIEPLSPRGFAHDLDQFIPFCAALLGGLAVLPDDLVRFRRHGAATSQAGSVTARPTSRSDVTDKARYLIETDIARSALRLAIVRAAIAQAIIVPPCAAELLKAFSLHETRTRHQKAALARPIPFVPLARIATGLFTAGSFTNDRPLRAMGMSLLLACIPDRLHAPVQSPSHYLGDT